MPEAMKYYTFPVIIEKEPEDPGYFAYSPVLPGCVSDGLTIEETRENMRDAMQLHVQVLIERGEPVPQAGDVVLLEELTLGIPA
jgi:predicted RNase H-like HicB family nuclease